MSYLCRKQLSSEERKQKIEELSKKYKKTYDEDTELKNYHYDVLIPNTVSKAADLYHIINKTIASRVETFFENIDRLKILQLRKK